jgi:hypothetical protein
MKNNDPAARRHRLRRSRRPPRPHRPSNPARAPASSPAATTIPPPSRRTAPNSAPMSSPPQPSPRCSHGKLDAVIIGTPDFLHEEQALAVLQHGLALYLEKPMALTTAACDRILEPAKKAPAPGSTSATTCATWRWCGSMKRARSTSGVDRRGDGDAGAGTSSATAATSTSSDWHADRRYVNGASAAEGRPRHRRHPLARGRRQPPASARSAELTLFGDRPERSERQRPAPARARHGRCPKVWPPRAQCAAASDRVDVEDISSSMLMELDNGVLASYAAVPLHARLLAQLHGDRHRRVGSRTSATANPARTSSSGTSAPAGTTRATRPTSSPSRRAPTAAPTPKIIAEFLRYVRDGGQTDTSPARRAREHRRRLRRD